MINKNRIYNASPTPLPMGTKLNNGKYEIICQTPNKGGFGRIYKAKSNYSIFAIKEFYVSEAMSRALTRSDMSSACYGANNDMLLHDCAEHFYVEAKLLMMIGNSSPRNVPKVHGLVFEENNTLYYAMDFIDGKTISEIMAENGIYGEKEAIRIIVTIGLVLARAHKMGLMHGDVSPNNIMERYTNPILVDFGNARSFNDMVALEAVRNGGRKLERFWDYQKKLDDMTEQLGGTAWEKAREEFEENNPIGTPGYAPPPVYQGKKQGDVFSLAATLYFMLTGEKIWPLRGTRRDYASRLREHDISEETINAILFVTNTDDMLASDNPMVDFIARLPRRDTIDILLG